MPAPPYDRRSLWSSLGSALGLELMLSRWRPGGCTTEHDHGGGFGIVLMLRGEAIERRDGQTRRLGRGRVMLCHRNVMHQVEAGSYGATMLHVYAGIHRRMRMRDGEGTMIEVPSDHGAWLP